DALEGIAGEAEGAGEKQPVKDLLGDRSGAGPGAGGVVLGVEDEDAAALADDGVGQEVEPGGDRAAAAGVAAGGQGERHPGSEGDVEHALPDVREAGGHAA